MALSYGGQKLFVGYSSATCVVAYDTSACQQLWTSRMANSVNSVSYHAGMVLVGMYKSELTVLKESDGAVIRKIDVKATWGVYGHAVIIGKLHVCITSSFL
jgi:outer membrane protein assembly factor BamB